MLGTAGLPHILMRFYTVPSAKEARRSVQWAIGLIGLFYLFTLVLGYGAAALVGPEGDQRGARQGQLGGPAVGLRARWNRAARHHRRHRVRDDPRRRRGLTITASASFAHDIYANVIKRGEVDGKNEEVKVARMTAIVIGIVAILGGIVANGQNIAFLVALAFAVAASANLPTILYSLFWKRFNTAGALWSIYGGLAITVVLIVFSPVVSGKKDASGNLTASMIQGVDFHWFPLDNPGIVSIPLSFLLGYLGTVLSRDKADPARYAEMEVRSLTGVGRGEGERALARSTLEPFEWAYRVGRVSCPPGTRSWSSPMSPRTSNRVVIVDVSKSSRPPRTDGDRHDHHEQPQRTRPGDPARGGGGRGGAALGAEPDLFLDGRCCCDQSAAHQLVRAGLIAAVNLGLVGQRVAAALTPAGRQAIDGCPRGLSSPSTRQPAPAPNMP